MGWSCLKTQSDKMDKIREWERSQPEYTKDKGNFIFFEMDEKDDFDDKKPVRLNVIEVINGAGFARGYVLINGNGDVIKRTYLELPKFND